MNEALEELLHRRVQIWSVGGNQGPYTDDGVLEAYAHPWVRLRKADGELLCFPIYHVRLVKLMEKVERDRHVAPTPGDPEDR